MNINLNRTNIATRLIFLISGICVSSWAPIIPYVKERLSLDEATLGLILLTFGVGAITTMPLTGWLVHRFGSRNVALIAGSFMIGFLPLLVIAPSTTLLSIILFLFGASNGAMNVSMNSHAVQLEALSPKPCMSGFHCLFSFGGLIGAGLLSMLLGLSFDLFHIVLAFAVAMLILLFTQYPFLVLPKAPYQQSENVRFTFPGIKVLSLAALCFIGFLAEGAVLDWSAVFLRSEHSYNESIAGIGYAAFSIAMSIGRLTGDRVIQSLGKLRMMQLGSLLAALGYMLAVFSSGWNLELLGFILIGLGASNLVPIIFSAAGNLPNTSPSTALAIVTTLGYAGLLLGPAIIGFVAQAATLPLALSGVGFLLLLITLNSNIIHSQQSESILSKD